MPSDFISRKLTQNIFRAFDFAKHIGMPLNTYAVINLRGADSTTDRADRVMEVIREKCRRWMKRRRELAKMPDTPPFYVYTLENPSGSAVHVNWVLHVPSQFQEEFRRKIPGWLRKAQGEAAGIYDIDVQEVDPRTDKTLAKYIVKGTDPAFIQHFHLDAYADCSCQGPIEGRRAGVSMSLNKAAREAAGFIAKRHRNQWMASDWARPILAMPERAMALALAQLSQAVQRGCQPVLPSITR